MSPVMKNDLPAGGIQLTEAAGLFAIAHQLGRIADVLEKVAPLIDMGIEEARKEMRRP